MIGRLIIAVHHHRRHCHSGSSSSLSMLFLFQFLLLFCCLKGYEHQPFLMFLHNWFDSSTPVTSSVLRRLRRVRLQPPVLHADRGRPPRRGRRMAVAGRPPAEGSLQRQGPRPALRRDPHTSFVDPHGCTLHSRVSVGELSRVRVCARACDVCDWSNTCKRMKWFLLRFRGRSAPPSWLHIHLSFS